MNTDINQNHGAGNWIAFLLGAIFNILASINTSHIVEQTLNALIGGIIWLLFHMLANRIIKKDSTPKSNGENHVEN